VVGVGVVGVGVVGVGVVGVGVVGVVEKPPATKESGASIGELFGVASNVSTPPSAPTDDDAVIGRIENGKNGDYFKALFSGKYKEWQGCENWSDSECDLAMLNIIRHYAPPDQGERIFDRSETGQREKVRDRRDYKHHPEWGIFSKAYRDIPPIEPVPAEIVGIVEQVRRFVEGRAQTTNVVPFPVTQTTQTPPVIPPTPPRNSKRIFPLPRIRDRKHTPAKPIVRGLAECGRITLLTGPPKHGKSTLVTLIAYKAVRGEQVLGLETNKCFAYYLDYENYLEDVLLCLDRLHIEDEGFEYYVANSVESGDIVYPWSQQFVTEIAEKIKETSLPPLIVVDSFLRTFHRAGFNNENDNVQIAHYFALYEPLTRLGCAIIILDHLPRHCDAMTATRGGGDKECAVAHVFRLYNAGLGTGLTKLTLKCFESRGHKGLDTIYADYNDGNFSISRKSHADGFAGIDLNDVIVSDKLTQLKDSIFQVLTTPLNTRQLLFHPDLKALGFKRNEITEALEQLVDEKVVSMDEKQGKRKRETLYRRFGSFDADELAREFKRKCPPNGAEVNVPVNVPVNVQGNVPVNVPGDADTAKSVDSTYCANVPEE
jgi:hypothetical protein